MAIRDHSRDPFTAYEVRRCWDIEPDNNGRIEVYAASLKGEREPAGAKPYWALYGIRSDHTLTWIADYDSRTDAIEEGHSLAASRRVPFYTDRV